MPSDTVSRLLWAAYLFLWFGGVGSNLIQGGTPPNMAWAAPVFLALAAVIAIRSDRSALIAAGIGFVAEVVGVATGYPFGAYSYTPVLAPALLGVPVVVAGAWMVLFTYVRQMRIGIATSALAMTALDLVIDPLAANFLGYWHWQPGGPYYGVPLLNFAGWFAVALLIFAVVPKSAPNRQAVWLGTSILLFFTALAAIHGYFFPAFLGAALSGLGYFRSMRSMASTTI